MQNHMTMLEDLKRAAWSRTSPVSSQVNSWEIRKDVLGNLVRYADFGRRDSPFGWELDNLMHSGKSDELQALHWKAVALRASPHIRLVTAEAAA